MNAASPATTSGQTEEITSSTQAPGDTPTQIVETVELPEPAHPASGLVFTNNDGTWWINRQGELEFLIDREFARFSPDKQALVYIEDHPTTYLGEIWLMDVSTRERMNLTNTPERDEASPTWSSDRKDVLYFGSDTQSGMTNSMFPTMVGWDGSGYQILDQETGGFRGVSLDGGTIIYGGYEGTGMTITGGSEKGIFDPGEYGLTVEKLYTPVWSPDGKKIAWFVGGDFDGIGTIHLAIALFDLDAKTALTLHPYTPVGGSSFMNELAWSPDGEWLTFTTYGEPPATGRAPNLWAIQSDGSDETYIGEGSVPVWRYDGQVLAFQALDENQTEEIFLVDANTWEINQIDDVQLPERIGFLLDWVVP